jgi:glyoxylase-like metal-dependent hydrolase (beta-lactamase superfamily II)
MANHLAFALPEERTLFSADHVMAWNTTVIAPPDGAMGAYMASLDKLRGRDETLYWPGHGGPVRDPQRFLRGLINHRRQREVSILNRLAAGDRTIPAIVATIYQGLKPSLVRAAGLSVFAHLEDLVERGMVATDGQPSLQGEYRLV